MSVLPKGWVETTLGELCRFNPKHDPQSDRSRDVNFVPMPAVDDETGTIADLSIIRPLAEVWSGYTHFSEGDVVFAKITPCMENGKIAVARGLKNGMACGTTEFHVLRPDGSVESDFLWRFLRRKSFRKIAESSMTGAVGQRRVPKHFLEATGLPLPPLAEQKRIVAKLDALNAKSTRARTELARIETLVARYKQAVLGKAFSGELTEVYRSQRQNLETYGDKNPSINRYFSNKDRNSGKKTNVMEGIQLSPLPSGWIWTRNQRLAKNTQNAICAGPFGTIFKAKDFRDKGIPIIFLRHVAAGEYRTHKPGFMDEKVWRELHQPYSVFGGELLVTKLGDPPGVACIYPPNAGTAMVTPDVIKMSVDESASLPAFLMYYFNSSSAKSIIQQLAFGLTRLRVDLEMFRTFPVPLPPLPEQHEIVRRIESAFARIDRLAAEAKRALDLLGKLDEAILAKAFRGELVPQDENDEPAEQLLARIRAERAAAPKAKRGRRKSA